MMSGPEYVTLQGHKEWPGSSAVRVGDMLYLSGDLGVGENGKLVGGGIQAEAMQTMNNIKATLAHFGAGMDNIVKCQIFLTDISERQAFNEIYLTFFKPDHRPARSAFAINRLVLGARVEVDCIAWLGEM